MSGNARAGVIRGVGESGLAGGVGAMGRLGTHRNFRMGSIYSKHKKFPTWKKVEKAFSRKKPLVGKAFSRKSL